MSDELQLTDTSSVQDDDEEEDSIFANSPFIIWNHFSIHACHLCARVMLVSQSFHAAT